MFLVIVQNAGFPGISYIQQTGLSARGEARPTAAPKEHAMLSAIVIVLAGLIVLVSAGCYLWVRWGAAARVFRDPELLPARDTALVLGTARLTTGGGENRYFTGRIDAAQVLFLHGKAARLILSGADRQPVRQTESEAMERACMQRGIPRERLLQDPLGYRTWDSMWVCVRKLGCQDPIVVSQRFHVERAVFIGRHMGMDPLGFAAPGIGGWVGFRMFARECLARVKCVLDCFILHPGPVYTRRGTEGRSRI